MKKQYVCVDVDGIMIGKDHNSGGYPWEAGKYGLDGVSFWSDIDSAKKYADKFKGLEVKEFSFTLTPIK
jgi:hypothetical protein